MRTLRIASVWSALALAACLPAFERGSGSDKDKPGAGGNPPIEGLPPGVTIDAAPVTMHRLTADQYKHTVRDLLGLTEADVGPFDLPADEGVLPSQLTISKLDDYAAQLTALGAHRKAVPCDIAGAATDDCAKKFISDFGARAFRRPLTSDEMTWLTGVYSAAKAQFNFPDSIDVVTRVMLQSLQFVYVREEGEPLANLPVGLLKVTQYELATRLSYLLVDSMPDEALFKAAADKQLTVDGLRAQAKRLLDDPRSRAKIIQFVSNWTEMQGTAKHVSIEEAVKDPKRFPLDNSALRVAVRKELNEFVGHVWDKGGSVNELFTSQEAYVNGPLAQLYGVPNGPQGDTWTWVTLPAQRAGLATRAAFLLVYANPDIPSPIRRGAAIWREFMCTTFPPPPPAAMDVKIAGGAADANGNPLAIRDTVIARTMQEQECAGCHGKINPAGFAFGHFDALGQWQDQEKGTSPEGKAYTANIDATGELVGSDVPGPIDGAAQFSAKLAASRQLKDCVASRFWTGSFGHAAADQEQSSLHYVQERLASSGSIREALLGIIESPAFLLMRKGTP